MFESTIQFLQAGVEKGWHTGGQLFISHNGQVELDYAFGAARTGVPMEPGTLLQWFSSGKPIAAVAIAQLHERRLLDWDDPVARHIPEFAAQGKEDIALRHLLNHTAGLRLADRLSPDLPWSEMIQRISETPIERDWLPGVKAGYSTQASWYILGEIVRRLDGRTLDLYAREEIFQPLGMPDSWLALPPEEFAHYGTRLGLLYEKPKGEWQPIAMQDAPGMALLRPGSSARGPVRELGRFYQMLLAGGSRDGQQILQPESIQTLTSRHRTGLYDHTFFHTLDFGFGFIIDSNRYGAGTVPYGYGLHASPETFGHSGAQSSSAFSDPAHQLVVAWVMNGLPGERPHQERARGLNTTIYEDLGLA